MSLVLMMMLPRLCSLSKLRSIGLLIWANDALLCWANYLGLPRYTQKRKPAQKGTITVTETQIPFKGLRLRFDSAKSYDELVEALLDDIGHEPVLINAVSTEFDSWDGYEREVASHVGPSGFILFASFDHGAWLPKAGIDRKVLRVILGNPLIAITMIRHDVTAGLFAPVEVLVTDEDGGGSALTYVVPSSLMVVEPNEPLRAAALDLDAKLAALAAKVTAT
jgi:uncharacterized protein (DUF302 family)